MQSKVSSIKSFDNSDIIVKPKNDKIDRKSDDDEFEIRRVPAPTFRLKNIVDSDSD